MADENIDKDPRQYKDPMPKDVAEFLINNGFSSLSEGHYFKGICHIYFYDDCYEVYDGNGSMHSPNMNIYWLIGVLTYFGFMDKNYQQGFEPTGTF